jgi:DnaJ domain/Tetratricopeptide repeat
VWCVADPDVIRYALGDLNRPLALTTDPLLRFQKIALTRMDGLVVSQADGVRTAKEVLASVPEDLQEAERSLFGLLCTGLLEMVDAPSASPAATLPLTREDVLQMHRGLAAKDHFEVLGIPHSATCEDARAAFVRLARRFHPDALADAELAGLRTQLDEIFARLAGADHVLSVPPRRAEYQKRLVLTEVQALLHPEGEGTAEAPPPLDPMAQAMTHEQMLVSAEQEFAEGRYWDALQVVESVVGELEGRMRRRGCLLRARALGQNPKWRKEAEDQFKEVLAADPGNVDALFHLGQLYESGGMTTRATAMFRKVLELRPRHAGALAALAS